MLTSLFWKRANLAGAIAGMVSGGATVFIWKYIVREYAVKHSIDVLNIYELLPAFLVSLVFIIIVSLITKAPDDTIVKEFEAAKLETAIPETKQA